MMKRFLILVLLFVLPLTARAASPIVVVISMDGLRPDYLGEHTPALNRLAAEGARAKRMTPVYPSNTFPGHVSMATGTYPDVHGIVDNVFIDRERGLYRMSSDTTWLRAEPLWIAAERQGRRTATYFWVGSENDWRGQGTSFRVAPFDGTRPEALKVAQIREWLSLSEAERPQLIMSYFAGTDYVAHRRGPEEDPVWVQLGAQDAALGTLLAAIDELQLWPRLTLFVVSDHGMIATGDHIDIGGKLASAGIEAQVAGTTIAHVFLDQAERINDAKATLMSDARLTVLSGAQAREAHRFAAEDRTGDLVVLVDPPYIMSRPTGLDGQLMAALSFFGWEFGGHGYAPDVPEMGATFLAMGRGVPAGLALEEVHQIDLAPTVSKLLAIDPPEQSEGTAVGGFDYSAATQQAGEIR